MYFMLDTSNVVSMYCGEMSVFRESFYSHIDSDSNNDKGLGQFLKNKVINSMTNFIDRDNAELQIILENKMFKLPDDIIFDNNFSEAIKYGKIKLSYLKPEMVFTSGMSHFSFTQDVVRMEKNKEQHTAICAVNAPNELIDSYQSHFENLKKAATPIGV